MLFVHIIFSDLLYFIYIICDSLPFNNQNVYVNELVYVYVCFMHSFL